MAERLPRVAVPGQISCFRGSPQAASEARLSQWVLASSLPLRAGLSPVEVDPGWLVARPSTAFAALAPPGRRPDSDCRLREYSGYWRPGRPRKRQGATWKFAWLFLTLIWGRMQQHSG